MPRASIFTLAFRPRADPVAMGFALFPASTVSATIVEIEPATRRIFLIGRDAAGGQLCRGSRRGLSCGHGLEMHDTWSWWLSLFWGRFSLGSGCSLSGVGWHSLSKLRQLQPLVEVKYTRYEYLVSTTDGSVRHCIYRLGQALAARPLQPCLQPRSALSDRPYSTALAAVSKVWGKKAFKGPWLSHFQ